MLAEMGWLVSPTPLRLPLLRRSERRVPAWVLSFMVLSRLKALLDRLDRRFEIAVSLYPHPKDRFDGNNMHSGNYPADTSCRYLAPFLNYEMTVN